MRCDEAVRRIEESLGDTLPPGDGGLSGDGAVALRAHVGACADCRAVRDAIRAGAAELASAFAAASPEPGDTERFVGAVVARLPVPAARPAAAGRRIPWARAAAVLAAVGTGWAAWKATNPADGPTSPGGAAAGPDVAAAPYRLAPPRVDGYAGPRFADVTDGSGITKSDHTGGQRRKDWMVETVGHGAAVFDMDGDGDLDLFVPDGNRLAPEERVADTWRLYRNDGGMRFTDVTRDSGLETDAWGNAAVAGDLDGDGLPDLYVACFGRNVLFRNLGGGRFEDVTARAGVAGDASEWSTAAALGDLDGDGDLDLYVANYADMRRFIAENPGGRACRWRGMDVACGPAPLDPQRDRLFMNRGDGTFDDATEERIQPTRRYSFQAVILDLDGDGHLDIYVASDAQANVLLRNDGRGRFREEAVVAGAATDGAGADQASMGVAAGDFDGDGRPDLFVTNFSHESNCLYRSLSTPGRPLYGDATAAAGVQAPSFFTLGWGASFLDYDSDGDLDLAYANGHLYPGVESVVPETTYAQHIAMFRNDGAGRMVEVSTDAGAVVSPRVHRGLVVADFDEDGHLDLFTTVLNGRAVILRNDGRGAGRSVRLVLRRSGGRVEAAGAHVVARVETATGEGADRRVDVRNVARDLLLGSSFASCEDPRVHVGLGAAGRLAGFTVRWPGGKVATFGALEPGVYEVVEGRADPVRLR